MTIINAEGNVLGRMASIVAKRLLNGENITILNAEKVVITGSRDDIFKRYRTRKMRGDVFKGPFTPVLPDMIVRRAVRGMLSISKKKGRDAYKRLFVYAGTPKDIKDKIETIDEVSKDKLKEKKYISIVELSKWMGAKI